MVVEVVLVELVVEVDVVGVDEGLISESSSELDELSELEELDSPWVGYHSLFCMKEYHPCPANAVPEKTNNAIANIIIFRKTDISLLCIFFMGHFFGQFFPEFSRYLYVSGIGRVFPGKAYQCINHILIKFMPIGLTQ